MNSTLKAPKEIVKAHRFIKNALREVDYNNEERYLRGMIYAAQEEGLHFVDTEDFISDGVKARLEKDNFNVFGTVIRWNTNA